MTTAYATSQDGLAWAWRGTALAGRPGTKIDMELIRGIDANMPRRQIVAATARMCEDMGMTVFAEGIETQGEFDALREMLLRYADRGECADRVSHAPEPDFLAPRPTGQPLRQAH